jgi:hypothetical protein
MNIAPKRDPGARSRPRKRSQAPGLERGATPFWVLSPYGEATENKVCELLT